MQARQAREDDFERIRALGVGAGYWYLRDLDFVGAEPFWVVVEKDDQVIACLQVCPGVPVGRAEDLALAQGLRIRDQAEAVRLLAYRAMALLKGGGSSVVQFLIPAHLHSYRTILEDRGAALVANGWLMMKRL